MVLHLTNFMIITGNLFSHRNINTLSPTSLNGQDQNRIDHGAPTQLRSQILEAQCVGFN